LIFCSVAAFVIASAAVDGMAVPDGDGGTVRTGVAHRVMKLAK
jgi:hypothetical protein